MLLDGIHGLADSGHDICVVGSGPVGLAIATDLVKRGLRVLLLESGRDVADVAIQSLALADVIDPDRHDDMMIATARRLGGTSHLWGARCLPFDPIDFEQRDWVDAEWPITYGDFAKYLPQAVEAARAGSAVFRDDSGILKFQDLRFECDHLERWANKQQAQNIHAPVIDTNPLLDVRTSATLVGMKFAIEGHVTHVEIAHSLSGDRVCLPIERLVLAAGGVENARLLLASQQEAHDRFGGLDGPLGRYYMGHVSGEIADLILRDDSAVRAFDYRIDEHGSYVRRRIVPSAELQRRHRLLNTSFWPVVPAVYDAQHRNAILSMVYLAMRWPMIGTRLVAEAIRKQHAPEPAPSLMPHLMNLITGAPKAAMFGLNFLRRRFDKQYRLPGFFVPNVHRRYGLSYHGEQIPNPDSRVTLGADKDRLGLCKLKVDYRVHSEDIASVIRTHECLEDWAASTGLGKIEYRVPPGDRASSIFSQACHGRHQIGLTRMAASRSKGVVDEQLTCFDAPNLHIASCSVLPTSGQANPTLTAIALALRLSERIAYAEKAPLR